MTSNRNERNFLEKGIVLGVLNFYFTYHLDNTQINLGCETSAIFILRVKKHLKCDLDAESPSQICIPFCLTEHESKH